MDRRKFVATGSIAGIPVVSANATSGNLGTPASLTGGRQTLPAGGKLTLPLDDVSVPLPLRDVTRNVSSLVATLFTDPTVKGRFAADPGGVLREFSLDGITSANDPAVDLLRLAIDPAIASVVKRGGYIDLLSTMKQKGLVKAVKRSKLKDYYIEVLKRDQSGFEKFLQSTYATRSLQTGGLTLPNERLSNIVNLLGFKGGALSTASEDECSSEEECDEAVAAAATAVWIAVIVYSYLLVVATVGVGVLAVVAVSTHTRIAVTGDEENPGPNPQINSYAAASLEAGAKAIRDMNRLAVAANLHGRKDLAVEAIRRMVDYEVEGVIAAAEQLRLIKVPRGKRTQVMAELKRFAFDSIGFSGA